MIDNLVLEEIVVAALREDIGFGDLTSELVVPPGTQGDFVIRGREELVVAGMEAAAFAFRRCAPECRFEAYVSDGACLIPGTRLARVRGPARRLLAAERTALNLLQRLSGIATLTSRLVERIAGTQAVLTDTRKTTPGLRALEKHAASVGGARNHRLRLDDGVLIKDNHIAVCGSIAAAVKRARAGAPLLTRVEVECDNLTQVREALQARADVLLLDNMDLASLREAVSMTAGSAQLEASGGVTLETIRDIALTGVDFISVGRITHSATAVDIGLDADFVAAQEHV